jgi:hypothetical protein
MLQEIKRECSTALPWPFRYSNRQQGFAIVLLGHEDLDQQGVPLQLHGNHNVCVLSEISKPSVCFL